MNRQLPKAYIFGVSHTLDKVFASIEEHYEVLGFVDNDKTKWGTRYNGITISAPDILREAEFDTVINIVTTALNDVTNQLMSLGIRKNCIDTSFVSVAVNGRIAFLEGLSELFRENKIIGCTAECGVFQGDFAKQINRVFPDSKLYLFDTFSGFDIRDEKIEEREHFSAKGQGKHFHMTSEELVRSKLLYPNMAVFKKGYFLETITGIKEYFKFVHLDFDLYEPTLAALHYFIPNMVPGGVILVHDYFSDVYKGVRKAVHTFETTNVKLRYLPIGDGYSIAIKF